MGPSNQRDAPASQNQPRRRHRRRRRQPAGESAFSLALLSLAMVAPSAQRAPVAAADDDDASAAMTVVGRYGPDQFRGRNGLSRPKDLDYTKVTRINYGPFRVDARGAIWGTDANADPQALFGPRDWNAPEGAPLYCHRTSPDASMQCGNHFHEEGLIGGAHANGAEVYSVVGGPEWSEEFSAMASDPEAREKFAQNAAELMTNYDFDGLDMAWQFPKSPEDMSKYGMLLDEVRTALDKEGQAHDRRYGLTATLPCSHDDMEYIDIGLLRSLLSEFNLLTVDFHGPWDGKVGVNSPLYDQAGVADNSVDGCVRKYLEGGVLENQINIALSFYGHSFRGGQSIGDECVHNWAGVCSDTQTWQEDGGSPEYHNIYEKMPGLTLSFDSRTMTPLAFSGKGVVSFDDPQSICLKAAYAAERKLNGFVIMDLVGDMLDDRSTPLLDALNLKIFSQSMDCEGEEFGELFKWRKVKKYNPYRSEVAQTAPSVETDTKSGPTIEFKYTCGFAEGDAKERCSSDEFEEISCNTGTCPQDMLCFVVACITPEEGSEAQEPPEEGSEAQEPPDPVPFTKRKPKPKPRKKPARPVAEDKAPLAPNDAEDIPARVETLVANGDVVRSAAAGEMSFSCGAHFDQARSCGRTCPNGIADCPGGQFCFWLRCDPSPDAAPPTLGPTPPPPPTPSPAPPEPPDPWALPTLKYQCGETRAVALTCPEDCGAAWQCLDGKDCYSVLCPP